MRTLSALATRASEGARRGLIVGGRPEARYMASTGGREGRHPFAAWTVKRWGGLMKIGRDLKLRFVEVPHILGLRHHWLRLGSLNLDAHRAG